jgi:hypothetical protein
MNQLRSRDDRLAADTVLVREYLAAVPQKDMLSEDERQSYRAAIKALLKKKMRFWLLTITPNPNCSLWPKKPGVLLQIHWKWLALVVTAPVMCWWWRACASWVKPLVFLVRTKRC